LTTIEEDLEVALKVTDKKDATHDCAFLEPLAFPPDFPPVILKVGVVWLERLLISVDE
jgi:hypothetical protein